MRAVLAPVAVLLAITIIRVSAHNTFFIPLSKEFLSKVRNESLYNRFATPTQFDGIPTNVSVSMFIEGMSSFSAQAMDFQIDIYFQQEWWDQRLAHNGSAPILVKDKDIFKLIWKPDLYFSTSKMATFQEVTEDNFLVWVYSDGRIWYDSRISLVSSCNMNLKKYPIDEQTCALKILSYAYPKSVLRLAWSSKSGVPPIDRNMEIIMPDMELVTIIPSYCNGTYATGEWACLSAVFNVKRKMLHHIMQTYLPTSLIVIISWFSFWLPVDSAPARVSLSITTLLTISTQSNAVKLSLPEVSYMKAVDLWMGACLAFVFAVMVEFTLISYSHSRFKDLQGELRQSRVFDTALSTLFGENDEHKDYDLEQTTSPLQSNEEQAALQMLRLEASREPRLRSLHENELVVGNGVGHRTVISVDKIKRKRPRKAAARLRKQTVEVSRRALNWTRSLRHLHGRRVAQRIDERCRVLFPLAFFFFTCFYWFYYIVIA